MSVAENYRSLSARPTSLRKRIAARNPIPRFQEVFEKTIAFRIDRGSMQVVSSSSSHRKAA